MLPQCASQTPASGDGNLLGHHAKMQDLQDNTALRKLARGSEDFFPIFVLDAGFQVLGNVIRTDQIFLDFRTLVEEEGAIFLGEFEQSLFYVADPDPLHLVGSGST